MTPKKVQKRLVVLDAHAIIHRAYHALPDFATKKGVPTGALYGLVTMLLKAVKDLSPDYVVAAYDLPGGTFRHDAYENYKAGRGEADQALKEQFGTSRDVFSAFSIPIYDHPGFEADDVLGTIALETKTMKDLSVVIVSGDMDTLQLVEGTRVQVFTLKKGINDTILYDEDAVKDRFGFAPMYLPDYKGLRGDPSDNIIGVPGIGEKTATTLISTFHTVENVYKNFKKKDPLVPGGITPRIIALLKEHEDEARLSKELATIRTDAPINFSLPHTSFIEGIDLAKISSLFEELEFRSLLGKVRALKGEDSLPEITPTPSSHEEISDEDYERYALALWLLDSSRTVIEKDDIVHFEKATSFSAAKEKIEKAIQKDGLSFVWEKIEIPLVPIIHTMQKRGILVDKKYLLSLHDTYAKELATLEHTIWKHAGHEFNINSPRQLAEVLYDELALTPSGKGRVKKTATGARSTRESELDKLRGTHPIIDAILSYRELSKLLSTYIDVLPRLVAPDGRLHAHFNQRGTTTGRFSSDNPNLQNLPIKTESGKKIRDAFIATPGYTLVSLDYSQIELRIAALLSQDPYLLKVFQDGKDVHAAVASKVFGVKEEDVTYEMRRRAKVINFGILYGMGVNALRANLGTERKEAEEFYEHYFAEFPTIASYLDSVKEEARKKGYTTTLFGRRRYFPDIKSSLPYIRAMAERMAINAPVQGTATADVIKLAIIDIHEVLESSKNIEAHLLMQVHDELVYEVKDKDVQDFLVLAKKKMISVIPPDFLAGKTPVPLDVGIGTGSSYGELK